MAGDPERAESASRRGHAGGTLKSRHQQTTNGAGWLTASPATVRSVVNGISCQSLPLPADQVVELLVEMPDLDLLLRFTR